MEKRKEEAEEKKNKKAEWSIKKERRERQPMGKERSDVSTQAEEFPKRKVPRLSKRGKAPKKADCLQSVQHSIV